MNVETPQRIGLENIRIYPDSTKIEYSRIKAISSKYNRQLMNCFQFMLLFNNYWDHNIHPNPTFVIAANDEHTVKDLVPLIKMIYDLSDSNNNFIVNFKIHTDEPFIHFSENVEFLPQMNIDELIEHYSGDNSNMFLFYSGFSTTDLKGRDKDELRLNEMYESGELIDILKPAKASIQFRIPHYYINEESQDIEFFEGHLFFQPFNEIKSSEGRMIVDFSEDPKNSKYSTKDISEQFNFFDRIVREQKYLNPYTNDQTPINKSIGLFNSFEDVMFAEMVINFYKKTRPNFSSLKSFGHGIEIFYKKLTENELH